MKLRVSSLIFFVATATTLANATSLSQPFLEDGAGPFDKIDAFIFTPGGFDGPGLSAFSDSSWTDANISNNWSSASGNALSSLNFNLNFNYAALPVTIDLFAFLEGHIVDSAHATYNGGWGVVDPMNQPTTQYAQDQAAAAPEPMSFILMSSGMIGLGLWGKKWRTGNKVLG
jgi:hypothetical protein